MNRIFGSGLVRGVLSAWILRVLLAAGQQGTRFVQKCGGVGVRLAIVSWGICGGLSGSGLSVAAAHPVAVMQGATTGTATELIVLAHQADQVGFRVSASLASHETNNATIESVVWHSREFSPWGVAHIRVVGLTPHLTYQLHILNPAGARRDVRFFKSLDVEQSAARVALLSCMYDGFHHADIWDELWRQEPDQILLLGDAVYADRDGSWLGRPATPMDLWRRYVETRLTLRGFQNKYLIPVLAVWDDHDYGLNNGDLNYQYKDSALKTFNAFFGQGADLGVSYGPGVARRADLFGVSWVLMDGRYFRSPADANWGTQYGRDQREWFLKEAKSFKPFVFVAEGDQFFGEAHGGDSFAGQKPQDFAQWLSLLKNYVAGHVLFLSGDRHYSEIMQIESKYLGYPTYEITSSSMHSINLRPLTPNPRRLAATAAHNFVILDMNSSSAQHLGVRAQSVGSRGQKLFDLTLRL